MNGVGLHNAFKRGRARVREINESRRINLIGLIGRMGSGKDTLFKLMSELPRFTTGAASVTRFAFADALKAEAAQAIGVTREFLEEHKAKFRLFLQWWGTEWRRGFSGEDYWIKKMAAALDVWSCPNGLAVITDVRFPNEAAFVKARGGKLIRVHAERRMGWPSSFPDHPSETSLDDYPVDIAIENNGTFEEFRRKVERLFEAQFLIRK